MIVILDTGVLGWMCNPNSHPKAIEYRKWLYKLLSRSVIVNTSEICMYEVKRGLILASQSAGSFEGIERLNDLRKVIDFLPITTKVLEEASILWASAQSKSQGTSNPKNIDVDIILCAQWKILQDESPGRRVVVVTENLRDLSRFADADSWKNISF